MIVEEPIVTTIGVTVVCMAGAGVIAITELPTIICVAPGAREIGVPDKTVVLPFARVDVDPPTMIAELPGTRVCDPIIIWPAVLAVRVEEPMVTTTGAGVFAVGAGVIATVELPTMIWVAPSARDTGVPLTTIVSPFALVVVEPPIVIAPFPGAKVCEPITISLDGLAVITEDPMVITTAVGVTTAAAEVTGLIVGRAMVDEPPTTTLEPDGSK